MFFFSCHSPSSSSLVSVNSLTTIATTGKTGPTHCEDEQNHNEDFPSVQACLPACRLPPLVVVGENLFEETEMSLLLPLVDENKVLLPLVDENKVPHFRLLVSLVNENEIRIFLLALVLNLSSNTLCTRNCSDVLRALIPDQSLQKSLGSVLSPWLSHTICLKNFNRHLYS